MANKASEREAKPTGPYGWVQWKGTDACMDIHCACGEHSHIDAYFAYYVKCPKCGAVYAVNGHVELVPLIEGESPDTDIIIGD